MPPTTEIDRTGDLTVVLSKNLSHGPEEKSTCNLLVSSKILSLASPVFAAMLSPRFREGQRSESGALDPISLPDDDAEAMTVLCQIFHFRYEMLPAKPSLELFKNLAVLCDKYDCVAPLRFVSETWLVMWEATASREDLEILLFVSFVFGRAERFAVLSGRIVREFSGNLKHLATLGGFEAVPEELLRGLQQRRKATLKGIEAAISRQEEVMTVLSEKSFIIPGQMRSCVSCLQFVQPTVQLCPKCRTSTAPAMCSRQSRRGEFIGYLRDAGLDPLRMWSLMGSKSINEIAACILRAQESSIQHSCEGPSNCLLKNTFVLLNKDIAMLVSGTKGLCLDCINNENEDVGLKPDCIVGHGKDGLVEALGNTTLSEVA